MTRIDVPATSSQDINLISWGIKEAAVFHPDALARRRDPRLQGRTVEDLVMTTAPSFTELVSIVDWIEHNTAGITFRNVDRRLQMATGCLDLAIEHQSGIAILFDQQRVGSAFALMRPLVDSFIRGVWLSRCSSDEGLDKFQQGKLGKTHSFADLVAEVESFLGKRDTALSRLTGQSWKFMSDFTHTGFEHVTRRHSPTHLGPNYPPAEIEQMIRSACTIGLLATAELVDLAGDRNLAQACKQRLTAFVATRAPDISTAGSNQQE